MRKQHEPEAPDLEELEVYQERAQGQRQFQALKASCQVLVGASTQPHSVLPHEELDRSKTKQDTRGRLSNPNTRRHTRTHK